MENKTFKITGNTIVTVGSAGKEQFLIDHIKPNGIVVQAQAENGVDILEFVSWDQISR